MSLNAKQTGRAGLAVFDGQEVIAEVRELRLTSARFRPGGRALIGETVPLFLYWMQYSDHEDPERNTSTGGTIELLSQTADQVSIRCSGTTASGACASAVVVKIQRRENPVRYTYAVEATLNVLSDKGWLVTPNPTQGEVEFANLWPDGTFSPHPNDSKRFRACYLVTAEGIGRIPHHHLETSDKHNIGMRRGDKFLWLLEDENPCLTITAENPVTAGVCAYMWDAHFAFKICTEGRDVLLPAGTHFKASYELTSIDADEAKPIIEQAVDRPAPDLRSIPLYVHGANHFTQTLQTSGDDWRFIWPWETEGDGISTPVFDLNYGFDDTSCLRIDSPNHGRSCWKVTTLGPAFGGKPFVNGSQYQLTAIVKTTKLDGQSMIAIRLHRENHGSVFEMHNYETFLSSQPLQGETDWTLLKVMTPPISPAPDRLHILLIQDGRGTTWFDDVHFQVLL